jgi:hypothetical protein
MEHLVDHFEVQRSSDNGGFIVIDTVKAVGESETPKYYSVDDNHPAAGMNDYRLREVDKDGNFYFTPVVSVNFDVAAGFEIYPNPANDYTIIRSTRFPVTEVNVFDVTGNLIQSIKSEHGQNEIRLNTAALSKGVYFIWVKSSAGTFRQKLFKQ